MTRSSLRRTPPPAPPRRGRGGVSIALAVMTLVAALPNAAPSDALAAAPYHIVDRWHRPGWGGSPFRKLVAVAITPDAAARRRYEDLFVSLIRGQESQGQTSYSIVPDLAHPGETEKVLEALFAGGVDGVITARPVPLDGRKEEEWAREWRAGLESSVRLRPYVAESLQKIDTEASEHGIEFALWDVQSGERLWSGRSTPVKVKKLRKSATELVQDVMKDLIFEKFL